MEVGVRDSWTWLGMALAIPQNAEYLWKTFPKGTLTLWNVLEFTYSLANDSKQFLSILLGSPPFAK